MLVDEPVPVGPRVLGVDTLAKLDAAAALNLAHAGISFIVRYVGLTIGSPPWTSPGTLDALERDIICEHARLGLMLVQFARTSGWSALAGASDGQAAAANLLSLELPSAMTLSCDLEGSFETKSQIIDYAGAWYEAAVSEGIDANALQVYVGAGILLDSSELFLNLLFRGYWESGSQVPPVGRRGYRMRQLTPLDQTIAGVRVDLDIVQTDFLGGRPRWARAA